MTTTRDFEIFKKTFRKYQVLFGLTGWRVYFEHEDIGESYANITYDLPNYAATVRMSKENRSGNVKQDAKHECVHLVLARLDAEAQTRHTSSDSIREANEETVNRLMEVIP